MKSEKRYLIRRLTIIDTEGETKVFPLVVLTCIRNGSIMDNIKMVPYEKELPGVVYLTAMTLRQDSKKSFEVISEQF